MQITETGAEGLKRAFTVTVSAQDIESRLQTRLREIGKTVRIPGFRPGKVPASVLKKRFGASVMGEVLEDTVNESSGDTIKDRNLRPALQPKIEITSFGDGQDLVYALEVEVLPEIEAPELTTITLERLTPAIEDSEIDESLGRLAENYRKTEPVEEGTPAANGDVVVIDFVGAVDGVEFPGGKGVDQDLELGTGRFIPGFEEQLVGTKVGDHVRIEVTFPEDYGAAHLSGKAAVFETDVKAVKRKLAPVIDDALAEEVGLDNLEALRAAIRERLEADYGRMTRLKLKRDLLDHFAGQFSFDVPAGMVEIEFNQIWQQFEAERERAQKDGTYQSEEGKTDDEIKAEYRSIAERRVRLGLLLAEIGRRNDIEVTQDELNRAITAQARQYPGQEKAVIDYYRSHPEATGSLRAPIYEEKVVDFIVAKAQITDRPVPVKELIAAAEGEDDEAETAA
jgi:trigger factor